MSTPYPPEPRPSTIPHNQPTGIPQYPQQASGIAVPAATAPQVMVVRSEKEVGIAYVLWLFFGALGVHQFYLGKTGRAVSYLFTLGWLTIGLWIDLFTLPSQVRKINEMRRAGLR